MKQSSSALSKPAIAPTQAPEILDAEAHGAAPAWKQEVNQRLAAHRTRRGGGQEDARNAGAESPRASSDRAAAAAARVAARYAKAPSYSQLLAGEARAVVRAAGAAAEAARSAQAAAQAVLAGLESTFDADFRPGPATQNSWERQSAVSVPYAPLEAAAPPAAAAATPRWQDEPPAAAVPESRPHPENARQENPWAGAQPRWEEALPALDPETGRDVWAEMRVHPVPSGSYSAAHSTRRDNAYRHSPEEGELFPGEPFADPVAGATVEPLQHLPANLIEFPREIVAAKKARPRLAEGPFYDAAQDGAQLSIFEVDPQLLAPPVVMNAAVSPVAPPEWASIELDHPADLAELDYPETSSHAYAEQAYATSSESLNLSAGLIAPEEISAPVQEAAAAKAHSWVSESLPARSSTAELLVARVSDRLLAAVVDGALVTLAMVAAAVVVIACTEHPPTGRIALIGSSLGLLLFGALYQFLFLSYAEEGTPGMRYARIALCTFDDDNPTVHQMRMRIPAIFLSALPAGLGLLWAAFDGEHLGWHDRMTRTYQRKY